jgi:hypothetical protein
MVVPSLITLSRGCSNKIHVECWATYVYGQKQKFSRAFKALNFYICWSIACELGSSFVHKTRIPTRHCTPGQQPSNFYVMRFNLLSSEKGSRYQKQMCKLAAKPDQLAKYVHILKDTHTSKL